MIDLPDQCPHCGHLNDSITPVDEGQETPPSPGDFSICFQCGELAVFEGAALTLRRPTPEEQADFDASPDIVQLKQAWKNIKQQIEEHRFDDPILPERRRGELDLQ